MLKPGQEIVGLYEAALPISLPEGREQSQLAQYLCEMIIQNSKEAVFVQVKADLKSSSEVVSLASQLNDSTGLLFKHFTVN